MTSAVFSVKALSVVNIPEMDSVLRIVITPIIASLSWITVTSDVNDLI